MNELSTFSGVVVEEKELFLIILFGGIASTIFLYIMLCILKNRTKNR